MSDRTQAASVLLAVQAAFRASDQKLAAGARAGTDGILGHLRDGDSVAIGELAERSNVSAWAVFETVKTLQDEGLVRVDASTDTVSLTEVGKAAVSAGDA